MATTAGAPTKDNTPPASNGRAGTRKFGQFGKCHDKANAISDCYTAATCNILPNTSQELTSGGIDITAGAYASKFETSIVRRAGKIPHLTFWRTKLFSGVTLFNDGA